MTELKQLDNHNNVSKLIIALPRLREDAGPRNKLQNFPLSSQEENTPTRTLAGPSNYMKIRL